LQFGIVGSTYRDNDQYQVAANGRAGGIFIWNRTVDMGIAASPTYAGLVASRVIEEISAHEIVHLFDVNPPAFGATGTIGHCTNDPAGPPATGPMASNGAGRCLMNGNRTNPERGDGAFGLHVSPWPTSEYRRVRKLYDPIQQSWQSTATPVP
jgi:hypothetical protein